MIRSRYFDAKTSCLIATISNFIVFMMVDGTDFKRTTLLHENHTLENAWSDPAGSMIPTRPAPSNMVFLGYQHNYYNYDQPKTTRATLSDGPRKEPFARMKLESSFKTSKSAKRKQLGFARYGNYGQPQDYGYEGASSNVDEGAVPVESTMGPKIFDNLYGLNTGNTYIPACVRSQLQTICLDDPFYPR